MTARLLAYRAYTRAIIRTKKPDETQANIKLQWLLTNYHSLHGYFCILTQRFQTLTSIFQRPQYTLLQRGIKERTNGYAIMINRCIDRTKTELTFSDKEGNAMEMSSKIGLIATPRTRLMTYNMDGNESLAVFQNFLRSSDAVSI